MGGTLTSTADNHTNPTRIPLPSVFDGAPAVTRPGRPTALGARTRVVGSASARAREVLPGLDIWE